MNSDEVKARVDALRARRDLEVRIYVGDPGSRSPSEVTGGVRYYPDPKGGTLVIAARLKDAPAVIFFDGMVGDSANTARFHIGKEYLVRVFWDRDMNCQRMALPTSPAAAPYIIWFDYEQERRETLDALNRN